MEKDANYQKTSVIKVLQTTSHKYKPANLIVTMIDWKTKLIKLM